MICYYCGRVTHRCKCTDEDSPLQKFLQVAEADYQESHLPTAYKRGVPPQIKRRERQVLRKNYKPWFAELVDTYGEKCLHCGATEDLAIDHVIPIAKGGLSELSNLQLLCATCNRLKGKLVYDCRFKS